MYFLTCIGCFMHICRTPYLPLCGIAIELSCSFLTWYHSLGFRIPPSTASLYRQPAKATPPFFRAARVPRPHPPRTAEASRHSLRSRAPCLHPPCGPCALPRRPAARGRAPPQARASSATLAPTRPSASRARLHTTAPDPPRLDPPPPAPRPALLRPV